MKRWYLFPFSILYDLVSSFRNKLFDLDILSSHRLEQPVIGVGNLSVGGTGKSPTVLYLVDLLLHHEHCRVGVLSRGYGRRSKGYREVGKSSSFREVGDEAMQLFQRFGDRISIAVCEDRVLGARKLIAAANLEVLVLDDSFQHRYINPGLNILLTDYSDPYFNDFLLPSGNLRESRSGYKRAQLILVTKCPRNISQEDRQRFLSRIKPLEYQNVFFSSLRYGEHVFSLDRIISINDLLSYDVLLVTGIANPSHMLENLRRYSKNIKSLSFSDHHVFTKKDVEKIGKEYRKLGENKIILTTQKDYVRLKGFDKLRTNLFYWSIEMDIEEQETFNQAVLDYVRNNKAQRGTLERVLGTLSSSKLR